MPRSSARQEELGAVYAQWHILWTEICMLELNRTPVPEVLRERLSELQSRLAQRSAERYANRPAVYRMSRPDLVSELWRDDCNPSLFRQQLRVTRGTFEKILATIQGHPVFHNRSNRPQKPVRLQLSVALNCFGMYGNGACIKRLAFFHGISEGSAWNYVDRVITALYSVCEEWISWPSESERQQMAARIITKYGLPGCVGFVDGTFIRCMQAPHVDPVSYYGRHSCYGHNVQIICDDQRLIRGVYLGYPGSCHDATVFRDSDFATHPERFFCEAEWLLGDVAYPLSGHLLTPYKAPASNLPANAFFNTIHAKVRVAVEDTIGILKNRWSSLKELRCELKSEAEIERTAKFMLCCAILHNMALRFGDEWTATDIAQFGTAEHAPQHQQTASGDGDESAAQTRDAIRDYVIAYHSKARRRQG